jgi:hypothetical protein
MLWAELMMFQPISSFVEKFCQLVFSIQRTAIEASQPLKPIEKNGMSGSDAIETDLYTTGQVMEPTPSGRSL